MIRLRAYSAVLAMLCTVGTSSPAAAAESSSRTKLRVQLYNLVHLSNRNVRLSTDEAGRLLREAGVDIVWQFRQSEPSPPHLLTVDSITSGEFTGEGQPLVVNIVPSGPKGLPSALGYALPAEPDWIHAVIFDDRVEDIHYRNRVPYAPLLGSAIAHEVAHLLLRSPYHSVRGVMKARWDHRDILDVACGRLTFNPEECKSISRAARRRLDTHRPLQSEHEVLTPPSRPRSSDPRDSGS